MSSSAERIEKCLRAWEDFWFSIEVLNTALMVQGKPLPCIHEKAVVNWPSVRRRILKHDSANRGGFDLSDFEPPRSDEGSEFRENPLAHLISPIVGWCLYSRRIYQISKDLQAVLNATSLKGINWKDVCLPFHSYAVKLEDPFVDCDGDEFDFIFVNTYEASNPKTQVFEIYFLAKACDRYDPLDKTRKETIRKNLRDRNYQKIWSWIERFCPSLDRVVFSSISISASNFDEEVLESAKFAFEKYDPAKKGKMRNQNAVENLNAAIRIVVGMCLYLKTLPPQSPHQSDWRPAVRFGLPDPKAISNEAQICTVTSCYNLSTEEKIMLGLEGTRNQRDAYELCCHFREGHWRRPPGQGSDPSAQKTVHVRPCLVRRDRLQEGELPGGAQENM